MNKPELLSPVGDFECLKSSVQNGADSVYLGASDFSARAKATNFNEEELASAIKYAKLRNVKVYLTLNTLIKNSEFEDAVKLAINAYNLGADAIIVQDLGLATFLLKNYPEIPLHASTQMTVNNLVGVKQLESLGFKRVVLARELSLEEIENIKNKSNIELEVFIHGALCISYSGQCLLSSMIGGRSGNRGYCAQPCRLPYELYENEILLDKGYLLNTHDIFGIEYLPELIKLGITSFKIEGRLKGPEYVGVVTRIYRKYIDLVLENINLPNSKLKEMINAGLDIKNETTGLTDREEITEVFNRGGFSTGHFTENKNLIYNGAPNSMKGKILNNDEISTIKSSRLNKEIKHTFKENKEFKKVKLDGEITIKANSPITLLVKSNDGFYRGLKYIAKGTTPQKALTHPITEEKVRKQINKTGNTEFEFNDLTINLEDNLFVNVKDLNDLRKDALNGLEQAAFQKITHNLKFNKFPADSTLNCTIKTKKQISLLINILKLDFDYTSLTGINRVYIPLKYFINKKFESKINEISSAYNTYVYLPNVLKDKNLNLINFNDIVSNYNIKGFVISHISQVDLVKNYKLELIGNFTLNTFNNYTNLSNFGLTTFTPSVELNKIELDEILTKSKINTEVLVYGKIPVMTNNYCYLGKANYCYKECDKKCLHESIFYLKDRLNLKFRILPDNTSTTTTIFNSKIQSLDPTNINADSLRIDVIDEPFSDLQNIIDTVKNNKRFQGQLYTNGYYK